MPLDGPQWRIWRQPKYIDEDGKVKSLVIWKSHHSFCDGISLASILLAFSGDYGREYFVKSKDATLLEKLYVRLMVPFQIPMMVMMSMFLGSDDNILTKNKAKMNGIMNCQSSKMFDFPEIKHLSKSIGRTINDIVTSSISTSMGTLFKEKGDESKEITMVIPANIRFEFYPDKMSVKLENKFSAIPLKVPLTTSMQEAYPKIAEVTKKVKNTAVLIYASYILSSFGMKFFAKTLGRRFLDTMSKKVSLAFSNTPGPIKSIFYVDEQGNKIYSTWSNPYFIVAGHIGMTIACMSYCNSFKVSLTCDDGILDKQSCLRLIDLIERNLEGEIARTRDISNKKDQ